MWGVLDELHDVRRQREWSLPVDEPSDEAHDGDGRRQRNGHAQAGLLTSPAAAATASEQQQTEQSDMKFGEVPGCQRGHPISLA